MKLSKKTVSNFPIKFVSGNHDLELEKRVERQLLLTHHRPTTLWTRARDLIRSRIDLKRLIRFK